MGMYFARLGAVMFCRKLSRRTMRLLSSLATLLLVVVMMDRLPSCSVFAQELPPPQSQWEYHLGQGLRLGNSGLTLGGYGSMRGEDLSRESPRLTVSALSLFFSWETGTRVRFFSELELEDLTVVRDERSFDTRHNAIELERLYADVYLAPAATFRLGKFLTPIGRWNLIHADPLVWTTSRPLVTFQPFATDTTGGMLYGSVHPLGKALEYAAYVEATDDLDPDSHEGPFSEAVGLHLAMHIGAAELGFSYATFKREQEHKERVHLLGLDFFWTHQRGELTGEFLYRMGTKGSQANEWGVFVQGVMPLRENLFAVGRYEFFLPHGLLPGLHRWVAGLAFRPLPPLVIRAEYSLARDNAATAPEGLAASIAVLF